MSYGRLMKINGIAVKDPNSYTWEMYDVSSAESGMTEDYVNKKDIQKTFRKLVCVWEQISFADASQLLKAIRLPSNPKEANMPIWFLDAEEGDWTTKIFTCGDRSMPLEMNNLNRWEQITVNFIEKDGE